MPNIKIDVDSLTKAIRDEGTNAKERLESLVKGCVEEIRQAATAVKALPPSAGYLVATAELCRVAEIDTAHSHSIELRPQVTIDFGGGYAMPMASWDHDRRTQIPHGRYRAIFVLLPIEKSSK